MEYFLGGEVRDYRTLFEFFIAFGARKFKLIAVCKHVRFVSADLGK